MKSKIQSILLERFRPYFHTFILKFSNLNSSYLAVFWERISKADSLSLLEQNKNFKVITFTIFIMKLKKFLLRYYPPGIILEYVKSNGETEIKSIDLLNLNE